MTHEPQTGVGEGKGRSPDWSPWTTPAQAQPMDQLGLARNTIMTLMVSSQPADQQKLPKVDPWPADDGLRLRSNLSPGQTGHRADQPCGMWVTAYWSIRRIISDRFTPPLAAAVSIHVRPGVEMRMESWGRRGPGRGIVSDTTVPSGVVSDTTRWVW